jgi:hypothetical protein
MRLALSSKYLEECNSAAVAAMPSYDMSMNAMSAADVAAPCVCMSSSPAVDVADEFDVVDASTGAAEQLSAGNTNVILVSTNHPALRETSVRNGWQFVQM